MDHPYQSAPARAFWKRAVSSNWTVCSLAESSQPLLKAGEKVASAGSCFAANIVPFLELAGFDYIKTESFPPTFGDLGEDNFSYAKFSAAYGNIYTVRQMVQLLQRALGRFTPAEDRWVMGPDLIIDAFRPGLRWPAASDREFNALTKQHLAKVLDVIRVADCFIYTLGLTEAWASRIDGAVFPACPGTIGGSFDPHRHVLANFSSHDVGNDIDDMMALIHEINPRLRVILTVSPVPLVATATSDHVLVASTYSKSVLRAAAGEAAGRHAEVTYFPAYEIVTGPQAPWGFFEGNRREPSAIAIREVMRCFLHSSETTYLIAPDENDFSQLGASGPIDNTSDDVNDINRNIDPDNMDQNTNRMSSAIAKILCEEAGSEI